MKIIINLHNVGLGNNGGSRTLVRCAEVMSELGHEVILHSNHKSRYSWHKIDKRVGMSTSNKIPNGDVIIATGYKSVKSTVKSHIKRKFYYIRGFELWQACERDLIKSYKSLNCIVNSSWLHDYLKRKNIRSKVLYAGLDFDMYYDKNLDRESVIGGLFHKKHKTKRHDHLLKISKMSGYKLRMLGRECKDLPFSDINDFYNKLSVWVSTSELEGFHNPPTEAAMAGVPIVCTSHPRSGVSDYAIDNKTALVYPSGDLESAVKCVFKLMNDDDLRDKLSGNMKNLLRSKIGDRASNMKKFLEVIS